MDEAPSGTRASEWYVPKFGPRRFRLLLGLTFFPYTLMNASYTVVGALLSPSAVHWDRVAALAAVYLLSVGISAHALDATAPNRPWGEFLTRRQLYVVAASGLVPAFALGLFYAIVYAPLLVAVGVVEAFFLFAYNLELFGGRFHTDLWFAFSWGFLPVVAGFILQTNQVGAGALAGGLFGLSTAYVEINASRPYKAIKSLPTDLSWSDLAAGYERILKGVVASVLSVALFLCVYRLI
ncbi:MAG: hypothetical protein HY296_04330 [Thaumarchaeota archaeon]|nr:hypothetical protein [Nitrososphaerota archaeon]